MKHNSMKLTNEAAFRLAVRTALVTGLSLTAVGFVHAQEATPPASGATELDTIEVTGTRIIAPGIISSSPIVSIARDEIDLQQQPEIERIFRLLPITVPGDGSNVNNGTAGAATVNLRGLGSSRNLILIDGKRLTPYNVAGLVDTQMIPVALIDRIDLITGGASAVYGSDAMSGAINVITKRNFEGVEFSYANSITGESDGQQKSSSMLLGGNFGDGRGNAVMSLTWVDRQGVQLGQRPLGLLGIDTETGAGYAQFLAGAPPTPPADPLCQGPGAVAAGGSGTTIPTRIIIPGEATPRQFRSDGSIAGTCSVFNFNPFNYYQTPQERFGGTVVGHFDVMKNVEAYSRISYGVTNVTQQVAPSGIFGTPLWTPMTNALIDPAVRTTLINAAETARAGGGSVNSTNWRDEDASGTVTAADDLLIRYFRRTVELGARSTTFENSNFQFVMGAKTQLFDTWTLDVSYSRGQADRTQLNQGYTNITNIAQQVDSEDGVNCASGAGSTCVPMDLFGGFGTITPAMAAYGGASAIVTESLQQHIINTSMSGVLPQIEMPFSSKPIALSVGYETRREQGNFTPDECLKTPPASCLGGAGGNSLPIAGGFKINEFFGETFIPLLDDVPLVKSLDLELGYRTSDFEALGGSKSANTWKVGLAWTATDAVLVRVMQQRSVRAPNIGELFAPVTTGLDNATEDPCSIANATFLDSGTAAANTLRARCVSTGMVDNGVGNPGTQVGAVPDIISGQINGFFGSDQTNPPSEESGDSFTIGAVLTPTISDMVRDFYVSIDYYDIKIDDYIDTFGAQETLDLCYVGGVTSACDRVKRLNGDLITPGAGLELFTTNLAYRQAEGIELGVGAGFGLGDFGGLKVSANVNKYLTQEFQSSSLVPVVDCLGHFGPNCRGPRPEIRWIQRTTWDYDQYQASLLWRHLGSASVEPSLAPDYFPVFRKIDAYNYFDLSLGYKVLPNVRLNAVINNMFEKEPPVVGNEAADTGSNSGNTFPSQYDVLGRVYIFGVNASF